MANFFRTFEGTMEERPYGSLGTGMSGSKRLGLASAVYGNLGLPSLGTGVTAAGCD